MFERLAGSISCSCERNPQTVNLPHRLASGRREAFAQCRHSSPIAWPRIPLLSCHCPRPHLPIAPEPLPCHSPDLISKAFRPFTVADQAVRFVVYSSFLPDVRLAPLQPTPIAPGTYARSALRIISLVLRKRTASGFGPTTSSGAMPFAKAAKNFAVPRKSTFTSLGATSLAFLCPSTAGQKRKNT